MRLGPGPPRARRCARRQRDATRINRLTRIADEWHEIEPSEIIRESAARFLRVHPLRAADALQLAAAFIAWEHRPPSLEVITLDERLADAARRGGFALVDLTTAERRMGSVIPRTRRRSFEAAGQLRQT